MLAILSPRRGNDFHISRLSWFGEGLKRHGIKVEWAQQDDGPRGDFMVCWGWRQAQRFARACPTLVMEAGYLGERLTDWISLGWNGLNGEADFCLDQEMDPERARQWEPLLKPCRPFAGSPVTIMGQVQGDCSIGSIDLNTWYHGTATWLRELGYQVRFRPHPIVDDTPSGFTRAEGSLEDVFRDSAGIVTYSSNSGVDAVMAGVPGIAQGACSMVKGLVPPLPPFEKMDERKRRLWLARLAYCQWNVAEVRSGEAWQHIGKGIEMGSCLR